MLGKIRKALDNTHERDAFVIGDLQTLPRDSLLLHASYGSQRYRPHCGHLRYRVQDFGQAGTDEKPGMAATVNYQCGRLDYVSDIWQIPEADATFDAILCTEVLEHISYPIETLREFARLLKADGRLILTAPSNSLRHMDPYF